MMRALIVIDKLWTGGVTTSLINYLNYVVRYMDVDLLVFNLNKGDELLVPSEVNIINGSKTLKLLGSPQANLFRSNVVLAICRAFFVLVSKCFSGHIARIILFFFTKKLGPYDLAISYTHDVSWKSLTTGCNDFVISRVKANYKAAFVHCDFQNYGGYSPQVLTIYDKFDSILCVSDGCKKSFLKCFPSLSSNVITCENFTNINVIKEKSSPSKKFKIGRFNIVTVCRIDNEKGIFRALNALKKLYEEGFTQISWRIVGDGPDLDRLKREISAFNLENVVELCGLQNNPYPFINGASLFLLPSFHEAAPMVFGESQVLKVPILTTETTSAYDMVYNRKIGFVCPNSEDGIYHYLKMILNKQIVLPLISDDLANMVNNNAIKDFNSFLNIVKTHGR